MKINFFSCWVYQSKNDWSLNVLRIIRIRYNTLDEFSTVVFGFGIGVSIKTKI